MCQATVYLGDKRVAEDVISLQTVKGGVKLRTLFEEPKFVPGLVVEIDFLKHRVMLEPKEEHRHEGD